MSEPREPLPPRHPRLRAGLNRLGWTLLGVALTFVLLFDPLGIHPLDEWIHGLLYHPGAVPSAAAPNQPPQQLWTCGMHPQVLEDHPGPCPICGMKMVPAARGRAPAGERTEREVLFYRNPMDPTVTSPVPAKDSMGMDYVPVYADGGAAAAGAEGTVTIDPAVVQNMNVQTATVERRDLTRDIRTVGYLDFDQQKMVTVTTKYEGWIEKVYVNYIGQPVRRGETLFEIYSPELVQTQQELLSAREYADRVAGAPAVRERAEALVKAARTRLSYWDITDDQVEALLASRQVRRTLTVRAPASGVVMRRPPGLEGMAVAPGAELFHIADLSSLWLSVEVFEDQLPWLKVGSDARITLSYFPGEIFRGRVRFVEPEVSEATRTVSLRLEVPNADGRLRSGMYATVQFSPVVAHDALVVPTVATFRTGTRTVVLIAGAEPGHFAPREIQVGAEGDGVLEVRSGLAAGERVVTSAQFLIDSESSLRESVRKLLTQPGGAHAQADH